MIDINSNTGHWPFQQLENNSCKDLLGLMNRYGVDLSVVSNMNGIFYKNTHSSNEELYNEINSDRRFKDRFIPFGIINPLYAGWKHDLDICRNKFGMKGIRLYPVYHDYDLSDASCIELIRAARDKGMVVAFTSRMFDPRGPRHWMDTNVQLTLRDLFPVFKEVPDACYFLLNSGNIQLNEDEKNLFKKINILVDTSGRISNLYNHTEMYGAEKFAFGTHSPILDYLTGLLRIELHGNNGTDQNSLELLRSANALKMLVET